MTTQTLLSSIVEHKRDGCRSFMLNGESHAAAIVDAVAAMYPDLSERPEVTDETLTNLANNHAKVSILKIGESMMGAKMIVAAAGTLFIGSRGVGILPKGSRKKGYHVQADKVLDIEPGYDGIKTLTDRVSAVKAIFPQTRALTQEDLNALPNRGDNCRLAVFGTLRLPDFSVPGCIWFLHSYMKEEDIAEGAIIGPPPCESEHGSVLGQQLMRAGGAVVKTIDIPFKTILDLTRADYEDALKLVR